MEKIYLLQGCVLSPDFFSPYSEIMMRNLEGYPGLHKVNNVSYADDTVLIPKNKEDFQPFLDIIEEKSRKKWLELNSKTTQVMAVSRSNERPHISMFTDGNKLKQRDQLKYLGTLISSDGRNYTEIASRTAQAKKTFQRMKSILTSNNISIHTRRRALECYIE